MDIVLALKALIMGLVEGFTEFLPISSTGHLILTEHLLGFQGMEEQINVFEIVIQAGAILAVCWEFRARIAIVLNGLFSDSRQQRFALNVVIAFLPLAVLGMLFGKVLKEYLFKPVPVALAFIIGGIIILIVERRAAANPVTVRVHAIEDMTPMDALKMGIAQAFALIPGTSRSGSTIIGGMMFGLSRKVATEFSFFLAIPTLLGATAYSLFKARDVLSVSDLPMFGIGTVAAFISAFLCVRWLLRYISSHTFTVFAWYRIAFGLLVLITGYLDLIVWVD
ncbi:undecaprenyl-diphosphate phosphatase [Duganella aceris]|jgi:undecaprenyl-diphosphatase|uniref:Undecaprenyl-diphosphatase n=1 Tax=Duganella aceris TaxID=2703883 RepID=A0ABX0FQH8_9BURK|nr:undecaprenyl-diphosphate phosphatase [Duganella aceris]NGZ86905.1 undecaprenyl-diphosphate phosphatase [Duganella aceris]